MFFFMSYVSTQLVLILYQTTSKKVKSEQCQSPTYNLSL